MESLWKPFSLMEFSQTKADLSCWVEINNTQTGKGVGVQMLMAEQDPQESRNRNAGYETFGCY